MVSRSHEMKECKKCGKPLYLAQQSPNKELCINCYLETKVLEK